MTLHPFCGLSFLVLVSCSGVTAKPPAATQPVAHLEDSLSVTGASAEEPLPKPFGQSPETLMDVRKAWKKFSPRAVLMYLPTAPYPLNGESVVYIYDRAAVFNVHSTDLLKVKAILKAGLHTVEEEFRGQDFSAPACAGTTFYADQQTLAQGIPGIIGNGIEFLGYRASNADQGGLLTNRYTIRVSEVLSEEESANFTDRLFLLYKLNLLATESTVYSVQLPDYGLDRIIEVYKGLQNEKLVEQVTIGWTSCE